MRMAKQWGSRTWVEDCTLNSDNVGKIRRNAASALLNIAAHPDCRPHLLPFEVCRGGGVDTEVVADSHPLQPSPSPPSPRTQWWLLP